MSGFASCTDQCTSYCHVRGVAHFSRIGREDGRYINLDGEWLTLKEVPNHPNGILHVVAAEKA